MEKLIFHVDVNNAFLSWTAVSLLKNGHPIDIRTIASIIGGDEKARRGIVLAKSPVAKKYGIKTAQTLYEARKKCPGLKSFPPDMKLYKEMSDKLYHYLLKYTPDVKRASIDECFLDMTGTSFLYEDYEELAYHIKDEIKKEYGFTVNVGIAHNELCAKMASDFEKPDKVHTLFKNEVKEKLWPLPVSSLFLVGKKTVPKLQKLNIFTIEDLANADLDLLNREFKSHGKYMKSAANGEDARNMHGDTTGSHKSISTSKTLPKDVSDIEELKKILLIQTEEVARSLRKQKMYAQTVSVIYKNTNFQNYTHGKKLSKAIDTTEDIYKEIVKLLEESYNGENIRLIGLRLSDLVDHQTDQISLFEEEAKEEHDKDKMQKLIDEINEKYGSGSILSASLKK